METENRRHMRNEKAEKISVPPGFVSLLAFTLKNVLNSEAASTSMAASGSVCETEQSPVGPIPRVVDISTSKSNLGHRPWILDYQPSYDPGNLILNLKRISLEGLPA